MSTPVAVITGGAKGIGKATADLFLEKGWSVAIISRTASELEKCKLEWEAKAPGRSFVFEGDVSNEASVTRFFAETTKKLGSPRSLINNAAIFLGRPLVEQSLEDWEKVFAVNVRGAFLCSRALAKACLAEGKPGAIVFVGSLAGIRSTEKFPGLTSYAASKAALVGLTESLAVELKSARIRVNCVAPGAVDTEMLRQALPHLRAEATPAQIAEILYPMADPDQAQALTGSVLEVHSNAK